MRTERTAWTLAATTGAVFGGVAVWRRVGAPGPAARTGSFANGIDYAALGTGPRTMLFLPGGPGTPSWGKALARGFLPGYAVGEFTVWWLSRRRNMPTGHTIADMADDVADAITELGGQVDAVVGASYGGMIALYLAARHPDKVGRVVLLASAASAPDEAKEADRRWGEALGHGRFAEAGEAVLAEVLPGNRLRWLRRLLAPLPGRMLGWGEVNLGDILVETQAELDYDARHVLSQIGVPVLIIAGDRDNYLPRELIEETAQGIPDCTVIWHKGKGPAQTIRAKRSAGEVLAFLDQQSSP